MKFAIPVLRKKLLSIPVLALTIGSFCVDSESQSRVAEQPREDRVSATSWKSGSIKIAERTLALSLGEDLREYEIDIPEQRGRKYFRLQLRRTSVRTVRRPSIDCWWVGLKQITRDKLTGGDILGANLLSVDGPGVSDSVGGEDWAAYLCPVESPQKVLDSPLYPIRAERNFFIESFLLNIQVTDYEYDEKEIKLKKMNVTLQLKNPKRG